MAISVTQVVAAIDHVAITISSILAYRLAPSNIRQNPAKVAMVHPIELRAWYNKD